MFFDVFAFRIVLERERRRDEIEREKRKGGVEEEERPCSVRDVRSVREIDTERKREGKSAQGVRERIGPLAS